MCSVQSEKPVEKNALKINVIVETREFIGIAIGNRLPKN